MYSIVPKSLLYNWKSEWEAFGLEPSAALRLRLHIQHSKFTPDAVSWLYRYHLALEVKDGEDHKARMKLKAQANPHDLIVLTTAGSYWRHVQTHFQCWRPFRETDGDLLKPEQCTDGLAWGRMICDEVHLYSQDTSFYRILTSLANNGWTKPNVVGLTATPRLRGGVSDMLPIVRAINEVSPDIALHPHGESLASEDTLDELDKQQQLLSRNKLDARGVRTHAARVAELQNAYTIQRRDDTIQNGKHLGLLPPLKCFDVMCPSKDEERPVDRIAADLAIYKDDGFCWGVKKKIAFAISCGSQINVALRQVSIQSIHFPAVRLTAPKPLIGTPYSTA